MLKQYAKKYQLIIWSQQVYNGDQNYRILTILGFSYKQQNVINALKVPFTELLKNFQQTRDTPILVKMGKLFVFNKYGMHQRQDQEDCQICLTQNKSKFQILNCCGKSVCDKCKRYYPDNICPFCKQPQINLRLIMQPTRQLISASKYYIRKSNTKKYLTILFVILTFVLFYQWMIKQDSSHQI